MPETGGPDKLSLVIFSGGFDRVHYALTMAAGALAVNRSATLFFTMGALRALLPADLEGPGWRKLAPTEAGIAPLAADAALIARDLAGFEEMLAACATLGAKFMVCEMGLRAMGLAAADLRTDIAIAPGGLVTFLEDASRQGGLVFV